MELTYTQCGDYLIPDLVLSDTKEYHIGKYGRLRRAYLKEHRPITQSSSHQASAVHPENTGVNNINNECSFLQFCLC